MYFLEEGLQLDFDAFGQTRPDLPHGNFTFEVLDAIIETSDLNTVDDLADYRVTAARKFRGFKDKGLRIVRQTQYKTHL